MKQRLPDDRIRETCRALLATHRPVSGRHLRRILKERFNAVGNTERIFRIWREESDARKEEGRAPVVPLDARVLHSRMTAAEALADEYRQRAERAELREQAHQDRWALEIDSLRQQLRAQPKYAAELRSLQDQVLRLTVELHAARRQLQEQEPSPDNH